MTTPNSLQNPTDPAPPASQYTEASLIGVGLMNVYFLIKWLFWWRGYIDFHGLENLALAALVLAPIRLRWLSSLRITIAVPFAITLLYYDTNLPAIDRVTDNWSQLQGFTLTYLLELLRRFISVEMISASLIIIVLYMYIVKWVRVTVLVCIGLLASLLIEPTDSLPYFELSKTAQIALNEIPNSPVIDLTNELEEFYLTEKERPQIDFVSPNANAFPFDIIILNICSLSWDDLNFTGLSDHPLLKRFDVLFKDFGSAASYSGPAAIRLLRSSCGQSNHASLYEGTAPRCYLFDELKNIGFEKQWGLNHDGEYDDYKSLVIQHGQFTEQPFSLRNVPFEIESFDGTPIHNDLGALTQWLSERETSASARVALFYNSITLHDGNRYIGDKASLSSLENFHPRLNRVLTDINDFLTLLETSNNNAIVIMVPEHGAAIRGDKLQIAGLREIPTPSITKIPVGIKFVGPDWHHPNHSYQIDAPASYYGLADLLAKLIIINPFQQKDMNIIEELLDSIPTYRFVSENEGVVVVQRNEEYYIRLENNEWIEYN